MIELGLAWTLTLVSAYLVGASKPELPPEQGAFGMTDAQLYDQLEDGDPLGTMSFGQAVASDPRRIEAMVLQRVLKSFVLGMTRLDHPNVQVDAIKQAMRHAYLERNSRLRGDGRGIDAEKILDANKRAWKMNADVLKVAFEMETPEAIVLKQLMAANKNDIERGFREAAQICAQASTDAPTNESAAAWSTFESLLGNMSDMICRYISAGQPDEIIDDEFMVIQPVMEEAGAVEPDDMFGALSFDEALAVHEQFGQYFSEHEEYLVTGHRAPAVGLAQYRRMGGRVF